MHSWSGPSPRALLAMALLLGAANGHAFHESRVDGVLYLERAGPLPSGVHPNCLDNYKAASPYTHTISSTARWTGGIEKVRIRGMPASAFQFNPNKTWTEGSTIRTCASVREHWNRYEAPSSGLIRVTGTLSVGAGVVVEVQEGFDIEIDGGQLEALGTPTSPTEFRGTRWNGIQLVHGANALLRNCAFKQSADSALRLESGTSLDASGCVFENNSADWGGAIYATGSTRLEIHHSVFRNNQDAIRGGAIYVENSTNVELLDVTFSGNEATYGGAAYLSNTNAVLANVTVVDNEATHGGGLYIEGSRSVQLVNAVIAGNTGSQRGGGIYLDGTTPDLRLDLDNPTIAFNSADEGSAIYLTGALTWLDIRNGIVHGNRPHSGSGAGPQLRFAAPPARFALRKVLLEGGISGGLSGPHSGSPLEVIDGEPHFRIEPDAAGSGNGSVSADFRLGTASAAINAGDYDLFPSDLTLIQNTAKVPTDRDGQVRNFRMDSGEQPQIDLGAYEFPNNPPTLIGGDRTLLHDMDEKDQPLRVPVCADFSDVDVHDGGIVAEQAVVVLPLSSDSFGELFTDDSGRPGDRIMELGATLAYPAVFFRPTNRSADYSFEFECRVRDTLLDAAGDPIEELSLLSRTRQHFKISVKARNDGPAISSTPMPTAEVGERFEYQLRFDDPDLDHAGWPVTVQAIQLPPWLKLDRTQEGVAVVSGTAPEPGEYEVVLRVLDPGGAFEEQRFVLKVDGPPQREPLVAGNDVSAAPGELVELVGDGPSGPGYQYAWTIIDRGGNTVLSTSGRGLQWTAVAGRFVATLTLSDNQGKVLDQQSLGIIVADGYGVVRENERKSPSSAELAQLDGLGDAGDPANRAAWDALSPSQQASALAELAQRELTPEQRQALLNGIDEILAQAKAGHATLDSDALNLVLGALDNAIADTSGMSEEDAAAVRLSAEQIDLILGSLATALSAGIPLDDVQLSKIAIITGGVLAQRGGEPLPPAQYDTLVALTQTLQEVVLGKGHTIAITGSPYYQIATTLIAATETGPVSLGGPASGSVAATLSPAALDNLRTLAGGGPIAFGVFSSRATPHGGFRVTVIAYTSSGQPLAAYELLDPIALAIPVTDPARTRPRAAGETAVMTVVTAEDPRWIGFDAYGLGMFELAPKQDAEDDFKRSSDSPSCFLGSLL